ncbi:MAG: 4-alpha-glucanotransferase, partial [Rhodospirillales bacterium]|nr:4-alpha-glucanotransferase [Rhodospirillales bacterium]
MEPDGMVDELAELAGIESDFWTFSGEHCIVSRASKAAILKAMGFPAGNPGDIRESLRRFQGQFHGGMIGPVHVYRGPRTHYTVPVNIPARRFSHPLKWRLFADDGACWSGEVKAEGLADSADMHAVLDDWERRNLPIPRVLPWGYHRLSVEVGDCPPAETTMIVAPEKAFLPDWLSDGEKRWGLACFLPGLQSETNWGIGDFTDLGEMVAEAGRIGASYVGLNPLHALFPGLPEEASPYSPSSRLFLNAWQIDVTRMDGFSDCQALHDFLGRGETKTWLRDVRQTDLIDYQAVAEGKLEAFQILFQHFQARHSEGSDDPLRLEFRYFIERGGRHLRLFAAFESLHRRFGVRDWRQWPPEFRDPRSAAVTEYCGDHPNELAFHMFLQWQADRQLSMVAKNQEKWNGRPVGLYGDLAVGCHLCGADSWIEGDFFAGGICFG